MKNIKVRGLVLREYEAGESDKCLILLCKEYGKLVVYARGARKQKSKYMAAAQLFAYSDFILNESRNFKTVAQAEVIESFYNIRADYDRLCHAHYIMEICDKTILEDTPCDDLLLLLLKGLSHLNGSRHGGVAGGISPKQAACVFLLRFLKYYGLTPETAYCCICGETSAVRIGTTEFDTPGLRAERPAATPASEDGIFFCDEGLLCRSCLGIKPRRVRLSRSSLAAVRHILNNSVSEAFLFHTGPNTLQEAFEAGQLCFKSHFDIKLTSEGMLGSLD